jgi:hypothetical protein
MDQHRSTSEKSPAESPAVASCEKTTGELKTKHTEPPLRVIYPKIGKGNAQRNLERKWSRDQRERVRESVTQGEGISTPHVRRTRRDPRSKIMKRLLNITHTHRGTQVGLREGSSIGHRILCLHISSGTRIRATVVRLTHAKQHKTHKQMANVGPDNHSMELRQHPNQNTLKRANVEPDRQSLDLRRHPNPKHAQNGKRGARQPITGLTSASEPKHKNNNWLRSRGLEPSTCQTTHTKRKKSARRGLARPPAYIPRLEQGSGRCSSPERERSSQKPRGDTLPGSCTRA